MRVEEVQSFSVNPHVRDAAALVKLHSEYVLKPVLLDQLSSCGLTLSLAFLFNVLLLLDLAFEDLRLVAGPSRLVIFGLFHWLGMGNSSDTLCYLPYLHQDYLVGYVGLFLLHL